MPEKSDRNFTMLTTGWLLLLSGAWALGTCTTPVALLGAMRGGAVAVLWNTAVGAPLLAMGWAMATRKPWAFKATLVATAFYSLDKLQFILDAKTRTASLAASSQLLGALGGNMGNTMDQLAVSVSTLFLAGWWGLFLYIYLKRDYFDKPTSTPTALYKTGR